MRMLFVSCARINQLVQEDALNAGCEQGLRLFHEARLLDQTVAQGQRLNEDQALIEDECLEVR